MSPLMKRIKFKDFLNQDDDQREELIRGIQQLRMSVLEEARLDKGRATKSATKNKKKRGVKVKDPSKDLAKLMKKLSPAQIKKIKEAYSV